MREARGRNTNAPTGTASSAATNAQIMTVLLS
jgi:hypothetical protein